MISGKKTYLNNRLGGGYRHMQPSGTSIARQDDGTYMLKEVKK
jgi:hypothetical protein